MIVPIRVSAPGESPANYLVVCPQCKKQFEYKVFPHQLAVFGNDFVQRMGYEGMLRAGCVCGLSDAEKSRWRFVQEAVTAFVGDDDGEEVQDNHDEAGSPD